MRKAQEIFLYLKDSVEKSRNMREGNPYKLLFIFMIPLLIGNVFQQLYNLVDSYVVGQYLPPSALSAVGSAYSVLYLLLAVFIGFGLAAMIMVAQFAGKKDEQALSSLLQTSYSIVLIISVVLSVLGVIFTRPLLELLQLDSQPEALEQAVIYLRIIFIGLIAQLGFNVNAGFLQGLGDSFSSLIFLVIASILNIGLDFFFVLNLHLGVAGVAYATVLAQLISWVLGVFYLKYKFPHLKFQLFKIKVDFSIIKEILKLGFPISVQQIAYGLSHLFLLAFVNKNGTIFAAGFNLASKIESITFLPLMSMGTAITTFTAQNMTSSYKRQAYGRRAGLISMFCLSVFFALLGYVGREYFLSSFTSDSSIIEQGAYVLQRVMPFYLFFGLFTALNGIFQGTGNTVFPMMNTLLTQFLLRIIFVVFLFYFWAPTTIYYAYASSWVLGAIFSSVFYFSGQWKAYIREVELENQSSS